MKLVFGLLALFFLPGSISACWDGIQLIINDHDLLKFFLIGIAVGELIYFLFLRRWNYFLTFEHELTHAIMSLLFFRKIEKFIATRNDGGVVYHSGGFGGEFGNTMITLAPYYFITFTFLAVLFMPLVPQKFVSYYICFTGATWIFHHLSTVRELRNNWSSRTFAEAGSGAMRTTDIASSSFLFSFVFILTMTFFFNGLIFWFLKYSYSGIIPFLKFILSDSLSVFNIIITKLTGLIGSIVPS
jgi:hypothetical protein